MSKQIVDVASLTKELQLPNSCGELLARLKRLQDKRKNLPRPGRRLSLSTTQRTAVLQKTDFRCHLCGGKIGKNKPFTADHVLPHAGGGKHTLANYLAAHRLCNGCRWFYSPQEFQWILRMGIWARQQMEDQTKIGKVLLPVFWRHEKVARRPRNRKSAVAGL